MRNRVLALAAALALSGSAASGQSVTVDYTISGVTNNWLLNFTVHNNIAANQEVYFWGTMLNARGVVGSPLTWGEEGPFQVSYYGGSSTPYNDVWIDSDFASTIATGGSLGGFLAVSRDYYAPTSLPFFAFGTGDPYYGGDAMNNPNNPLFEGIATAAVVATPEPASVALVAIGLLGIIGVTRQRRKRTVARSAGGFHSMA